MKRNPGYLLQNTSDTYFLLPYGQLIADHRRGISLNETGAFVWKLLKKDMSRDELLSAYLDRFMDEPSQKQDLTNDLNQFLNFMISLNFIRDDPKTCRDISNASFLLIGGLTVAMNCPDELIDASNLGAFRIESSEKADICVSVTFDNLCDSEKGKALIIDPELEVYENDSEYSLLFPSMSKINGAKLTEFGTKAFIHCKEPVNKELCEQFFHVMRHIYLYIAQRRNMYAIHSASILYNGRAWLFSACSGTGKSTHTNLWKKLYGTEILNGDLNLLTFEDGKPIIRGIPWCGTSEIFSKTDVPLGGIVFLKQAAEDECKELSPSQKPLFILQRFISPMWTRVQLEESFEFAKRLAEKAAVCRLECTKNDSAAEVIKKWIDAQI